MDGHLSWDEVLELKSINDRGFQNVVEFGPKTDHKWQATAYMLATGMTATRFVYENKNTNSVKEYLFELDETMALEVRSQWQLLDERTESKTLFPMLHDCLNQRGPYRWCPFSAICEEATWPSA